MSSLLYKPNITHGEYPERKISTQNSFDEALLKWFDSTKHIVSYNHKKLSQYIEEVETIGNYYHRLQEQELLGKLASIRDHLHSKGLKHEYMIRCFAIIREIANIQLGMRPHNTQLMGAFVILNGRLAEMQTGEGKTLTASIAASTAALAGIPVHVITANEYLANRDAEKMMPLYQALGLTVTAIKDSMGQDEKKRCYQANITYCTSNQVAFDYLRDYIAKNTQKGKNNYQQCDDNDSLLNNSQSTLLRGLCFAIVDEADSVLIDEAKTPLIIARENNNTIQEKVYQQALSLATQLTPQKDFKINNLNNSIHFTNEGKKNIEELTKHLDGIWTGKKNREYLVQLALSAKFLYIKDKHYLIKNNKIHIIDPNTGRVLADRTWERGVHQMLEMKEGCALSGFRETIARITYQTFFRRYLLLGGMSGTLKEVRSELNRVYGLNIVTIPTHKPCQRKNLNNQVFSTAKEKYNFIINQVMQAHKCKCPILIGTSTLKESEIISSLLSKEQLEHQVLNARQDEFEAEIIAKAGLLCHITVATNMAGRGTDISLGPGVKELGGLFIIATELNESKRIDRQLYGRCARQGDPGSHIGVYSLEDDFFTHFYSKFFLKCLHALLFRNVSLNYTLANLLISIPQNTIERKNKKIRLNLLQLDTKLNELMLFTGKVE